MMQVKEYILAFTVAEVNHMLTLGYQPHGSPQFSSGLTEMRQAMVKVEPGSTLQIECPRCGHFMEDNGDSFGCSNEDCGKEIRIVSR